MGRFWWSDFFKRDHAKKKSGTKHRKPHTQKELKKRYDRQCSKEAEAGKSKRKRMPNAQKRHQYEKRRR
jgi:hypothetical protein